MQYLDMLDPSKKDGKLISRDSQRSLGDSSRQDVDEFNPNKNSLSQNNEAPGQFQGQGFTNMNKDQYRKSSKENFLQKMNSNELISSHPSHAI